MVKIGMADFEADLAKYELGYYNEAMYAHVEDEAWIEEAPFELNGQRYKVGHTFSELGTRPRRRFWMHSGHWLEYAGRIDDLVLFKANGQSIDGWYYAFFAIEGGGGRLVITNLQGAASDIW